MATEHLHHRGEDARLNHTDSDLRFEHRVHFVEAAIVVGAVVLFTLLLAVMLAL